MDGKTAGPYIHSILLFSSISRIGGFISENIVKFVTNNNQMSGLNYIPLLLEKLIQTSPEKIILFGSYAYGRPDSDSDIDILVVTKDEVIPSSFAEKGKIYLRVAKSISDIKKEFPVDLIVHTKAMHRKFIEDNSLFARELLTKGKVLYEKSN